MGKIRDIVDEIEETLEDIDEQTGFKEVREDTYEVTTRAVKTVTKPIKRFLKDIW